MPTACILQSNASIHLKSRRLEISRAHPETGKQETLRSIPIHDLDRLIMDENVHISSQAMAELMRESIPVSLIGWNGRFLGGFLPVTPAHGAFRLNQYRCSLEPEFVLDMAKRWVHEKIYNQRRVLQRLDAARRQRRNEKPEEQDTPEDGTARLVADELGGYLKALLGNHTIDEIRGYEGASTSRYFRAWSTFLPKGVLFERRSTRPPHNPVNACISFASTMLYQESVAFLYAHGLDPCLGSLHSPQDGRWSLALDMIEPFRPVVGEALTLDLFSRSMLDVDEHFEPAKGGIYLNVAGRRKFMLQYERRMERQFMSEHAGHRTTLRQQLEAQAVAYKSALIEPALFKPFKIN
jgi:CRISPR-associated protein Cas1